MLVAATAAAVIGAANVAMPANLQRSILEGPIHEDRGPGSNANLEICAANESRFIQATYSIPLTAYIVGWKDPNNLADLLESVSPSVPVPRRFSWKKMVNSEFFLSELDDIRAIGSEFKRVEFTGSEVDSRTYNKGLTIRVDRDEQVGTDWQQRYVGMLKQRLLRNDYRRATVLLAAAGTNTAVTWNAASQPDQNIRNAFDRAERGVAGNRDGMGMRPNRALIGGLAWSLRQDAYEADTTNASRYARAGWSKEQLQNYLMAENVTVTNALYQSAAAGKTMISGNLVIAYYATSGLMKDDPSSIKRFVSATETSGFDFAVYIEEHPKFVDVTVEHYSNNIITSSLGVEKLTVS